VTLLPLSAGGAWVDYVYALVSLESTPAKGAKAAEKPAKARAKPEVVEEPEEPEEPIAEIEELEAPVDDIEEPVEAIAEESAAEESEENDDAPEAKPEKATAKAAPGFSKLFDSLAGLTGFHAQSVKVEPVISDPTAEEQVPDNIAEEQSIEDVVAEEPQANEVEETIAEEPQAEGPVEEAEEEPVAAAPPPELIELIEKTKQAEQPSGEAEGLLQDKLTQVRAMADEARLAKLRANSALYEGLSAAYDFALDAEDAPEEYLRLVEAQGLKIQLRSPMKPVVKLAFDGMCDDATIKQLEAVLAWAFDQELPRGALAAKIEAAGGIGRVLSSEAKAA